MAAPYVPPSPEGRPELPPWNPPAATKADLDYAKLRTIDLSLLDSPDPKVVDELVATTKAAIKDDGFLYLTNYGISLEQLHRQFAIGQYTHRNISEEDKERLHWNPSSGIFAGYKPPFGQRTVKGKLDGICHFNFYEPEFESMDRVPSCIHPWMDEITAFSNYLTKSVNRRLLILLSRVLELPDDFLWEKIQSRYGTVGEGYFRHALFQPLQEETRQLGGGLRMNGHCDYGTTTLLFSVPITCLQIWGRDEEWHYVKYNPGALLVNIGETLEVISGGHFKATRHRVYQPPEDQAHEERLSLVLFNASEGDLRLAPAMESPLIQREGFVLEQGVFKGFKALMDQGVPVPTMRQWRESQISTPRPVTENSNLKIVMVNGKKMNERNFFGVPVLLPV